MPRKKIMIAFEHALIDVTSIRFIDKAEEWSDKEERLMFNVVINDPNRIKVESFMPLYKFEFRTNRLREVKYQALLDKLIDNGVEII